MALIYAYDKRTGEPVAHPVPEHWLDHPVLGQHLVRTKPARTATPTQASEAAKKNKE